MNEWLRQMNGDFMEQAIDDVKPCADLKVYCPEYYDNFEICDTIDELRFSALNYSERCLDEE